ncbi:MAG: glycosyltransferase family 2 protein [Anaerolineales bacterium]|nr:glycosyltransferase family 2 protein [Anaerolineales bacterium]
MNNQEVKNISEDHKKPTLVLLTIFIWGLLIYIVIWPWIHQIDKFDVYFSILTHISAAIWWSVLLWALHHMSFQIISMFKKANFQENKKNERTPIAILFTTCDDFNLEYLKSCLDQDYDNFRVYVCDDSKLPEYKDSISKFCKKNAKKCVLVTRANNKGFKAGNLNNALENIIIEDWILLVDSDQFLPSNYLSKLVSNFPKDKSDIAFIQYAHQSVLSEENSPFQTALSPGITLYYFRDMMYRENFGLVPMLGHGAMISRSAWDSIGGFPEVVSEDFAFALRSIAKGFRGVYNANNISYESFPFDFGGFMVRLRKFASGTAELIRREVPRFLLSPAHFVEKWDLLMMLIWYPLMLFVTINGFLGAYVCHKLWEDGLPYLHPVLPYIYTWFLLSIFALHLSITKGVSSAIKFYFWSTAIYTAATPIAGLSFWRHIFTKPTFNRTPKNQEKTKLGILGPIFMVALGFFALFYSYNWISPFSPLLAGQGIAYISYPLYSKLNSDSLLGSFSRVIVYIPGLFMIIAIYAMWKWGTY